MTACGGVRLLLSARFSCASIERARHQQRLVQFCSSLLSAEGRILFLCVSLCVFFSLSLARYADVDVDAASLSSSSVFMHVCKRRHQLGLFTIDPLLLLLLLERCRCVRLHRRCRRRRCQSSLVCIYIYYTRLRLRLCLLLLFSVLPVRACVRACVLSLSLFFLFELPFYIGKWNAKSSTYMSIGSSPWFESAILSSSVPSGMGKAYRYHWSSGSSSPFAVLLLSFVRLMSSIAE